jgi:hypothetical protein
MFQNRYMPHNGSNQCWLASSYFIEQNKIKFIWDHTRYQYHQSHVPIFGFEFQGEKKKPSCYQICIKIIPHFQSTKLFVQQYPAIMHKGCYSNTHLENFLIDYPNRSLGFSTFFLSPWLFSLLQKHDFLTNNNTT